MLPLIKISYHDYRLVHLDWFSTLGSFAIAKINEIIPSIFHNPTILRLRLKAVVENRLFDLPKYKKWFISDWYR